MAKNKGPLSQTEKYAIQGMLADGKTVDEVEVTLGRQGTAVKNYISKELDNLLETVVNARVQRVLAGEKTEEVFNDTTDSLEALEEYEDEEGDYTPEEDEVSDRGNKVVSSKELIQKRLEDKNTIKVPEKIAAETLAKLKGVGMKGRKAKELLDRATKKLTREPTNAEEMFSFCLRQLNMLDAMITETGNSDSDEPIVAVMTGAASAKADDSRPQRMSKPHTRRGVKGNVYEPKTGKYK